MAETLSLSLSRTPWPRERGSPVCGMLCREILEGFRKTRDPFAPLPPPLSLGLSLVLGFCASLRRLLVRRCLVRGFSADFSSTFWRFKNRCSRVTQKCTENLRKNLRKNLQRPNGPARGGTPFHLRFLGGQHVTQSPLGRRTQGEHVRVYRDIFGLKGMLAFAPRFFKN